MEECELCGKRIDSAYVVDVEGVELRVCTKCASGKRIMSKPETRPIAKPRYTRVRKNEEEPSLREDYGNIMRRARERMKLPLGVLAEMLNEKETLLLRVEQGKTLPSASLIKKLEKALGIRLYEKEKAETNDNVQRSRAESVTMADYLPKAEDDI